MNPPVFDRYGFAMYCQARCGQLVTILITLEPYGVFGSDFAYLFLSSHSGVQNGGEGLPGIILAGQCLLVKMLIALEPHGVF